MSGSEKTPVSDLPRDELEALTKRLLAENAEIKQAVAELRAAIAQMKGLMGRPKLKPSGLEPGTEPKPGRDAGDRGAKGRPRQRRAIDEDRILPVVDLPAGSRFKGYEDYLLQDLVLRPHVVRLRRERWLTPDGRSGTAPLPADITGHFGPQLRRFVLLQYHQGQVTVPRLVAQLQSFGLTISKRQVLRLLNDGQDAFRDEAREVLRAGHRDYVVNTEALTYMRRHALAGPVIARLAKHPQRYFADEAAWMKHLRRLSMTKLAVTPDPVRLATEGALWGSITAHGLLPDTVIVSDEAGQFALDRHALCWVHAERQVHRLDTFTDQQHAAQQWMRALIWWFYADLKAYRRAPDRRRRSSLRQRFDRIFRRRTGFATLDRVLQRLHAHKEKLLAVLDRPEIPLHTNSSERDLRPQVIKRKISGGTRSDAGRDCRDAFLGLLKTCRKLGLSFWDYLGARLGTADADAPWLPNLVRLRSVPA